MSGQYQNAGNGSMERNKEKRSDKSPDFKGRATIEGKQYWLSGWNREDRDGNPFVSLSFEPKLARDHQGAPANPPPRTDTGPRTTTGSRWKDNGAPERRQPETSADDFSDDIPF